MKLQEYEVQPSQSFVALAETMVNHSSIVKRHIILLNYVVPFSAYIVFFVVFSFDSFLTNAIYILLLAIGFVITLSINKRKYLYAFSVLGNAIEINYYNVFLKSKVVHIPLVQLTAIETTKANPIAQYPCALNLKTGDKWEEYPIVSKELKNEVKRFLASADIGLPK